MARRPKQDEAALTRIEEVAGGLTAVQLKRIGVRVIKGPDKGKRAILEAERIRFGRGEPNDVPLSDDLASRLHAELSVTKDGLRLVDLGSRNGTFLGPHRVADAFVAIGDKIKVGNNTLVVEAGEGTLSLPLAPTTSFGALRGGSVVMRRAIELLGRAARTDATVLLMGETGTGKEEAARALHAESARANGPFVVVDCGAIPSTLLGSELFGHEKGAFTGAVEARMGKFQLAHGGTLFLDELGELAPDLQPQLLRVIERREVQRLGGGAVTPVDVRFVAATNRDLRRDVNAGRFRADLYFRLAVVEVTLPPLRERPEDIPIVFESLLESICQRTGIEAERPTPHELEQLAKQHWPGNVRELRNLVERRVLLGGGLDLPESVEVERSGDADALPLLPYREAKARVVDRFEREYVERALSRAEGNISKAARDAQMDRAYLVELIRKHGLGRSQAS